MKNSALGLLLKLNVIVVLLFSPLVLAQETVSVEADPIRGGLYLLLGGGGANAAVLLGDEGALVVDTKLDEASAAGMLSAITAMYQGDIRYVINTHEHPDHTGGNLVFGRTGALIISHEGVREVLANGQRGGPPAPLEATPVVTFGDGAQMTLYLNDERVEIRHMPPAHTAFNSIVHFANANVYQLGDLYSPIRYPVIAGGTLQGFLDGLDEVLGESDDEALFIPGNGNVVGRSDVIAYREMLLTVQSKVSDLINEGKTLEEVVAAEPTAEFDGIWGSPDRFLPALYRLLSP